MGPDRRLQLVALLLVFVLAWILSPVLIAIVFGGYVAIVGYGPYERLVAVLRGRRSLAAALVTTAVVLAVLLPLGATIAYGAREAAAAFGALSRELSSGRASQVLEERLPAALADQVPPLLESARDAALQVAGSAAVLLPRAVGSVGRCFIFCLLTVVTMLFSFRDGPELIAFLLRVSPLAPADTQPLLREFREVALGLFRGGVLVALFHGTSAALGLVLFGVPQAFLLGLLCAVASFVPVVGTGLIAVPVVAGAVLAGQVARAIALAAWFIVIVGAGDHLLRPVFSKGGMALPRPLLFLTLFGALLLLGPAGILVGPLVGSLAIVALRLVAARRAEGNPP